MSKLVFLPGQRWISSTEPEAGLGIVVECVHRRVQISFPAIGEQRLYAVDNAPLNRVQYSVGDSLRCDEGRVLQVIALQELHGRFFYQCLDEHGTEVVLDELNLDSFVQFSKPQDRLFSGQIDNHSRFALRRETLNHLRRLQQCDVQGLLGARVQLLPHQFYIASEVAARHAPRVMLADEVGLGKTIEAGLIIHQQLVSGRANRVLIVVPDSLIHQWLVEMLRRFNLMFTILDEARCRSLEGRDSMEGREQDADGQAITAEHPGQNPFESAQLVLCNLSFLVAHPARRQQAEAAGWDLMVVDEAHHLRWSETESSPKYQCIEALAAQGQGLLLLTATPEQLGPEGHFARLRLLDPARYYDLAQYRQEEGSYRPLSDLVAKLLQPDAAQQLREAGALALELETYLGATGAAALQNTLRDDLAAGDAAAAIDAIVASLLDRHGTGRVLFRNTRDGVSGFPGREFHLHCLTPPNAPMNPGANLAQQLQPEILLGDNWLAEDPRVAWLGAWLAALKDDNGRAEKVLVICGRATTAEALGEYLDLRLGLRSAVFHEGMTLVARDRAAAYFADEEESAQVLVCSEIGSEGRNFQFARHLVLFDLPLIPDLLEQRIGRLDRIGQRHCVQIHAPVYAGSAQQRLADWYHLGLNAFERVCPVGSAIFAKVEALLCACLQDQQDEQAMAEVIEYTRQLTAGALLALQQGRDRLLELNSCKPARAEAVIAAVAEAECPQQLSDYMAQVFDQFGVEHSYHSPGALVLNPGDHMHSETFPGLLADGMTVTFQRTRALSREDMHFLSWEHPMVVGAMDMILGNNFGNTNICTLKLPPLKPGTLLLEAFFVLHCPAPKALQLHRFLPLTVNRVVVDANGKDLTAILASEHFDRLGQKIAKPAAEGVVRHARGQVTQMLAQAQAMVEEKSQGGDNNLVDKAIAAMRVRQQREYDRLQSLAQVNPNIRQQEIEYIATTTEALAEAMGRAEWRLDAIRLALTI